MEQLKQTGWCKVFPIIIGIAAVTFSPPTRTVVEYNFQSGFPKKLLTPIQIKIKISLKTIWSKESTKQVYPWTKLLAKNQAATWIRKKSDSFTESQKPGEADFVIFSSVAIILTYTADYRKIAAIDSHNQDCDWKKKKLVKKFFLQTISKCELFWRPFGAEHTPSS